MTRAPEPLNPVPDSSGDAALVQRYLDHVRIEKRLAERTVALYTLDLEKLATQAGQAGVALTRVHNAHIRRWVAQMHSGGRSARGIALILSGWRGFYVWLGRQGLIDQNPVQDVRAPKAGKPLPRALGVDESVQLATHVQASDSPALHHRTALWLRLAHWRVGGAGRGGQRTGARLDRYTGRRGPCTWQRFEAP
jgi:integrase/recombinase XerC